MAELKEAAATQEIPVLDIGTLELAHLPHCGSYKDIQRKTWSSFGNRRTGGAELGRGQRRNSRRVAPLPCDGPQTSATKRGQRRAAHTHRAATGAQCPMNAARERSRVRTLHQAFLALQAALPTVPPDTKLSKLDVLLLAASYIAHLSWTLAQGPPTPRMAPTAFLHPLKVLEVAHAVLPLCQFLDRRHPHTNPLQWVAPATSGGKRSNSVTPGSALLRKLHRGGF